jgi:hypothetical protein
VDFNNRLPTDLARIVDNELESGETLLWTGQPNPMRSVLGALPIMVFGLFFGGFAAFWIASPYLMMAHSPNGVSHGPPLFFTLFGVPFFLIGLSMVLSPLGVYRKSLRTAYGITNRRIVIIDGGMMNSFSVKSITPEQMAGRTRTQQANGSGDILFPGALMTQIGNVQDFSASRSRSQFAPPGLLGIPQVKDVDDLIRDTFGQRLG